MHNAGIAALGLNWRYLAFDVSPDDLCAAIKGAKAMKFIGLNLTVPHKLLALDMVDQLDESARQWGAVNTIRFEARDAEGQWRPLAQFAGNVPDEIQAKGFNTDADALSRALREELDWQLSPGSGVLVLAAGCRAANGLGMLLHQGAKALEIWSDKPAPLGVMRRALEKEVYA